MIEVAQAKLFLFFRKDLAKKYDVIIVGAGPAGIFAALELTAKDGLSVLIVEKGRDITKRSRDISSINTGWGGAGAFSDGKLTLSTETGGWLRQYVGDKVLAELVDYVDSIYLQYGAPREEFGTDEEAVAKFKSKAVSAGLILIPSKIRHLGTENCLKILQKMRENLDVRIDIRTETPVINLLSDQNKIIGVELPDGEKIESEFVIASPGREGAEWFSKEAQRLGLKVSANQVDIGVRVELPAPIMQELADELFESKLVYYSKVFEDQVRTFCMCPNGHVSKEAYGDVVTVNGHSYAARQSDNTNFALLVSTTFTEPFKEPLAYGKYIARLANLLGGGILVQRLGDLKLGRRSTPERIARSIVVPTLEDATPGDLSFVLPYRYLTDIVEMLHALDKLAPGVADPSTLLYGIEVKFYSSRVKLSDSLETDIGNLFAIGDGAGVTRGLVQASAAGVIVARQILRRKGKAA